LFVFTLPAQARVFSFSDRRIAPYIRGSIGYSQLQDSAFADSSGANTSIDGTVPWNYSGELGLALGLSDSLFLRFGAELLSGGNGDITGSSAAGAQWFKLDSSVMAFNPNIGVEFIYSTMGNWRFFTVVGVGMAQVTLENRYTMTPAGATALGKPSYNEKAKANAYGGTISTGLEALFTDNVTVMLDLGYRYLPVKELKLTGPVSTVAQPSGKEGDVLKNSDGSTRELDLGGVFASVCFRFYIW
jgi:hypothetical protein